MPSCVLQRVTATWNGNIQDTVTHHFLYDHGAITADIEAVVNSAKVSGPNPIPSRRARLSATSLLFAEEFIAEQSTDNRSYWEMTVQYQTTQVQGVPGGISQYRDMHPLAWPPQARLEFIEKYFVIEEARNVQAITAGTGRPSLTLGPIVNGARQELQEQMLDITRDGVVVVSQNVSSLDIVIDRNAYYQLSTNDATISLFGRSFGPRTLKYLGTDSGSEQYFDGIPYFPIETRIAIQKTTDRRIQSTGWKYYNDDSNLVNAADDNDDPSGEPYFIGLDGKKSDTEVSIDYRYLDEKDYGPLVS